MFISKTKNYDKDPTNPDQKKQFSVKIVAVIFNQGSPIDNVYQTSNRHQISLFSETSRCLKLKIDIKKTSKALKY